MNNQQAKVDSGQKPILTLEQQEFELRKEEQKFQIREASLRYAGQTFKYGDSIFMSELIERAKKIENYIKYGY